MRWNKVFIFFGISKIAKCERPNILVILLDDLGWADVGWNNHIMQTTPFLDEMANNGTILVCINIMTIMYRRRLPKNFSLWLELSSSGLTLDSLRLLY